MIANALLFLLWLSVWLVLRWPVSTEDVTIGIFVSAFVSFMTIDIFEKRVRVLKSPVKVLYFLLYLVVFVWECVKANIDVAWRVIHPDIPIRPGTVKVKTELKSEVGLTFLANSVTLTPGTTTVDVDGQRGILYVHRLYIKPDGKRERLASVERFEKILKRIFE